MDFHLNLSVRRDETFRGYFTGDEYDRVGRFYAAHPEMGPTPLRSLPALAARLGIGELLIKDETSRFGVEAFKIAGVRYAFDELGDGALARGVTCATAGNHGRAVARAARESGVPCTVFLPAARRNMTDMERATRDARIRSMRDDGAEVIPVGGSYEEAVGAAAAYARGTGALVVSDTSWDGYEAIPRLIMTGYTRIFEEAAAQWTHRPDAVLVQGGVGGLVCAAANWFAARFGPSRPFLIACEPENAACLLESARAGRLASVTGSLDTMMAGLRCAKPSPAAWPSIAAGIDAFVSVSDGLAYEAMQTLRSAEMDPRIAAGPSGGCGVAALLAISREPVMQPVRAAARLDRSTSVMAVVTEGA